MTITMLIISSLLAREPNGRLPLLPPGLSLVRAVVTEAKESGSGIVNRLRVEHVYHGTAGVVGKVFTIRFADQGKDRRAVKRSLRVARTAISLVKESNNALVAEGEYNYMRLPVQEGDVPDSPWAPQYETIKSFAEEVECVSSLSVGGEAVTVLERLSSHTNPYISSWAISRLSPVSLGSGETIDFLDNLLQDEAVPILGQLELDKAQLGLHGSRWARSEARLRLFLRWFTGGKAQHEAELVVMRLEFMTQHPNADGFAQDSVLTLVKVLAKNDKFPLAVRERAGIIMGWAAERYEEGDEAVFGAAIELMSADLPGRVRTRIGRVFVSRLGLNEMRRAVLQKLLHAEKTESVVAVLKEALARPNGEPKNRGAFGHRCKATESSAPVN